MARPIRIEFPGALYHVTSRGDRRENIYEDDDDREIFLSILGQVVKDFHWLCHAYCLMSNHYHLLIETPDGNLSKGMRQLNGVFTQSSNRRHGRSGHLFQGRYKGILVDKDAYLLELTRYIVLNPVRAGMVKYPEQWPWSSYRAQVGKTAAPDWLETGATLSYFSHRVTHYERFVLSGSGNDSIWRQLNRQVFLGDDNFVRKMQRKVQGQEKDNNIPKVQRRSPAPALEEITKHHNERNRAIIEAYATGEYSYQQIADHFGLHFTTVGNIIRASKVK